MNSSSCLTTIAAVQGGGSGQNENDASLPCEELGCHIDPPKMAEEDGPVGSHMEKLIRQLFRFATRPSSKPVSWSCDLVPNSAEQSCGQCRQRCSSRHVTSVGMITSLRNQWALKVCEGRSIRETSSMAYVCINPEYAFLGNEYDVTSSGHRLSVIASPPGFCWCLTTEYYDTARTT